jgi:hypothetical protein
MEGQDHEELRCMTGIICMCACVWLYYKKKEEDYDNNRRNSKEEVHKGLIDR